jgi:hypothetical protein
MKALLILITVCFSAAAFAQSPPPKTAKPKVQPKPQMPMGCKLVGTVKGTKIWAGDCADATGLRGAVSGPAPAAEGAPLSPPEPAASPIPSDQKQ